MEPSPGTNCPFPTALSPDFLHPSMPGLSTKLKAEDERGRVLITIKRMFFEGTSYFLPSSSFFRFPPGSTKGFTSANIGFTTATIANLHFFWAPPLSSGLPDVTEAQGFFLVVLLQAPPGHAPWTPKNQYAVSRA